MRRQTAAGDKIFGRYRIDSLIGEGGQGFVWKGVDVEDNSVVAVKELTSDSVELRRRFEREMELKLDHPNIIQVRHYGEYASNYYFVMEFLDGQNLSSILEKRGRLPEAEATGIIHQVAIGLACAHQNNIIHRDIKPENIMLLRDGKVKITDFGIACFLDKERMTRMGATMGTAHYMSPEQVEDVSKVDRLSDVFSLGVVFYELVTGKKPFDADMLGELYVAIITKEPSRPKELVPTVSKDIDAVIMKMLQKRPEDRFPGMEELTEALTSRAASMGASASAPARAEATPVVTGPAAGTPKKKTRTGVPCVSCQTVNEIGASFCAHCGGDLRARCSKCKAAIATGAKFCARCGQPVSKMESQGFLLGLKGGYCGERIAVDRDFVTMGRHSSNDISFSGGKDEYVSRFQARMYRERGCIWFEGWDWVKNGATTNGTFVNGRNIDGKGKVPLRDGDKIRLGDSFFRFELSDVSGSASAKRSGPES